MPRNQKIAQWTVIAAAAAVVFYSSWKTYKDTSGSRMPEPGTAAPELQLADTTGQIASLAFYRGKPVLLDFWATWCDTCRQGLPNLKKINAVYHSQGLEVLAPSVDDAGPKAVMDYARQNQIPWRVLFADSDSIQKYGVSGLPTQYLIDRKGIIVKRYVGLVEPSLLEQDVQALLRDSLAIGSGSAGDPNKPS